MSDGPYPGTNDQDHPAVVTRNARYGMVLFTIYLLIYGAFVALSAFAPGLMARPVIGGVNLAVIYGFGLIGLAFALAIVYMAICARARHGDANEGGER